MLPFDRSREMLFNDPIFVSNAPNLASFWPSHYHYLQTYPNFKGFHSIDLAKSFLMMRFSSQTEKMSSIFDQKFAIIMSFQNKYIKFRGFHSIDLAKSFLMIQFSSQTDEISPHFDPSNVPLSPNMPKFRGFHSIDLAKCFLMVQFSSQTDQISPHFDSSKVSLSPNMPPI